MSPRACRLLFVMVLLGLHAALVWRPVIMEAFGVSKLGPWFRDTQAMLAASDSARDGFDPFVYNPHDLLGERHIYSDWWYALGKLGLTRADHLWLGGLLVVLYWVAVGWVLPLSNLRQTLLSLAVCASPPYWLIFNRANPDLLMFTLLTLAAGLVLRGSNWAGCLALVPVALAIGLKYYPVLGAIVVGWPTRERKDRWWRLALMVVVIAGVAWSLRASVANYFSVGWLARGQMTFGAAALPMKAGWDETTSVRMGMLICLIVAGWAGWRTRGESVEINRADKPLLCFVLGAMLLVGNFFLTVGFLYKFIFVVWLLPGFLIWAEGRGPHRQLARFWLGALLALVWLMPLTCLFSPLWLDWLGAASEATVRRGVAATADALAWLVVVPVLWLLLPLLRALACHTGRQVEP